MKVKFPQTLIHEHIDDLIAILRFIQEECDGSCPDYIIELDIDDIEICVKGDRGEEETFRKEDIK